MWLYLVSFSSISSLGKYVQALFMLAFSPAGGSLVSLMVLSKMPTGMLLLGSADKNRRKLGWQPSSFENWSSLFSSEGSHDGIRWMFCSMIQ